MEDFFCCGFPLFIVFVVVVIESLAQDKPQRGKPRNYNNYSNYSRNPYNSYLRRDTAMDTEHRKEADCPKCGKKPKYRMAVYGSVETTYKFHCMPCGLFFEYIYPFKYQDTNKHLVVDAHCPDCRKRHNVPVVGQLYNDIIPCPPCYDKREADWERITALVKVED